MKTAGQILKDTRLEKKLELADVTRVTKIRQNFLERIENDDYSQLPSGATARGFIKNYSQYLGLNPNNILAVFRRDFVENPLGQIIPRTVSEPVGKSNLWTPRTTIIALVVAIFTIFGAYLVFQYRILTGPPALQITTPKADTQTTEDTFVIIGTTDPEATISVNGQLVALEKGGQFSLRVPLSPGKNEISVVATGKNGKTTIEKRTLTR